MIIAVQKSFISYTLIFNKYTFNEQILNSFFNKTGQQGALQVYQKDFYNSLYC